MRRPLSSIFNPILAGVLVASAAIAEPPPPPQPSPTLVEKADAILAQAESASDAALRWLRARVEETNGIAGSARAAAECQWRQLVEAAEQHSIERHGLFAFTPGAGDACGGDWTCSGSLDLGSRVVVLVHGLDEPGDIWADLAPALTDAGHSVTQFNYPNDQHPSLSADALGETLRDLRERGVERIDIVGHSMGGLIARDLVTRSDTESLPHVGRIVTLGTPNHGSALAPLRAVGEMREQFARWIDAGGADYRPLLGFLHDGAGEAADALDPGSAYLTELNARPLPEDVEFTVIIGRASPVDSDGLEPLFDSALARNTLGAERLERLRRQAGEVIDTVGDGVVTVESARLEGASDTVIVDANHRTLVRRSAIIDGARRFAGAEDAPPPGIEIVLDRLGDEPR